jgi:hypothetical protein
MRPDRPAHDAGLGSTHLKHPQKLSPEFSGTLRTLGFWLANGTAGHPLLEGIAYWDDLRECPSLMEQVLAIFANVIEFDDVGIPVNAKYAEFRAAQAIRSWCDPDYLVEPPFENWETALHEPPDRLDSKPWPAEARLS